MRYALVGLTLLVAIPCATSAQASCQKPSFGYDEYGSRPPSHSSIDACLAPDFKKPLFAREGTLVCSTENGFEIAFEVRAADWRPVQLIGIPYPYWNGPIFANGRLAPSSLGCAVLHEGTPITLIRQTSGSSMLTNLGYLSGDDLRNSPAVERQRIETAREAQRNALRAQICYSESDPSPNKRGKCFYQDNGALVK